MDGAKLLEQAIPRRAHQAAQQAVNRTAQSDDLFHASPPSARCPPARAQKIIVFFLFIVCTALVIIPPLDFRFGWSSVPWYVSVIGDALVAFSFYIFYLVSKVNTYAAANVRVEEGGINRHVRACPSPDVPRGTFPRDRYSARTRIMVGAFTCPFICAGALLSHSQRRESSYTRSSRLHRIHPEGPISTDPIHLVA